MRTEKLTEVTWNKLSERLRSFILLRVPEKNDTDDILQEVFIKLHEKGATLKNREKIEAWLFQVTRNAIIDFHRQRKKVLSIDHELLYGNPGKRESSLMENAIRDMLKAMDDLPGEYCEALCSTEFEGMSQKDYAASAGISYSAAKSRVQRGKRMLRDALMKCCHYQSDKYGTVIAVHPACCCCSTKG